MLIIKNRNFAKKTVDLSGVVGEVLIEDCNLMQENMNTLASDIFLNTSGVTSLTVKNCNIINHKKSAQITYIGGNNAQIDFSAIKTIGGNIKDLVDERSMNDFKSLWSDLKDYIVANPANTYAQFLSWWNANRADNNIVRVETFLPLLQTYMNNRFGISLSWASFRTWILNNHDATDFNEVI